MLPNFTLLGLFVLASLALAGERGLRLVEDLEHLQGDPQVRIGVVVDVGARDVRLGLLPVEPIHVVLHALVDRLPPLERAIVRAYYLEGRSQGEISRRLRRSQMFVSRHLAWSRRTLSRMVAGAECDLLHRDDEGSCTALAANA